MHTLISHSQHNAEPLFPHTHIRTRFSFLSLFCLFYLLAVAPSDQTLVVAGTADLRSGHGDELGGGEDGLDGSAVGGGGEGGGGSESSIEGLASEARHGHTLSKSKGKREPQREIFEKPRKQKINKSRDRIFSTLPPSRCPPNHVHHDPHGLLNIIMCSEFKKHSAFRKHTC